MNKLSVKIPRGIVRLSDCPDLMRGLPDGWIILNKRLTGCGATTYYLKHDPRPIILCSHRSQLLACKANADMHKDEVHLFKATDGNKQSDLQKDLSRLSEYLDKHTPNPFCTVFPAKILVTVDSLPHVISVLESRHILDQFTVISDEFQCLFSDAAFKGDVVLNYVEWLRNVRNVVFLSATPYLETYLNHIDLFKDLPYYELDWETEEPERTVKPSIQTKHVFSLREAINSVIKRYKANGYFEQKCVHGVQHKATEAVFYINSVADIILAIKDNALTPDECNIICSSTNENNIKRLDKIGFKVGTAQKRDEQHVTYTFCTKCAYEGIDMYHTNAYTYVFSNPNLDNLAVDVSIDLEQILGRQRLDENPFKTNATLFFLTTKDGKVDDDDDFRAYVNAKVNFTQKEVADFNALTGRMKQHKIRQIQGSHKADGFKNDYISIVQDPNTGEMVAKENELVWMSEMRAWDIRNNLYTDSMRVLNTVKGMSCNVTCPLNELESAFLNSNAFQVRMEAYCDFRTAFPDSAMEIEGSVVIPYEYHDYWNKLGCERIKANSCQRSRMDAELAYNEASEKIESLVRATFRVGDILTNKEVKERLQALYDGVGLNKRAKATDLGLYFQVSRARSNGAEGIRIE